MNAPAQRYTLEFIQSMLTEKSGRVSGSYKDLKLNTAFQPIFSLPHKRAIGFDASLRGTDSQGKPVSAETLFSRLEDYAETSLLDLLCITIHVHNFAAGWKSPGLLFVNLHPDVFLASDLTSEFLAKLCSHFQVPGSRLVIDIPGAVLRDERLSARLDQYRQLGCLISIDDFGVDNSDLDTIWDTMRFHAAGGIYRVTPHVVNELLESDHSGHGRSGVHSDPNLEIHIGFFPVLLEQRQHLEAHVGHVTDVAPAV